MVRTGGAELFPAGLRSASSPEPDSQPPLAYLPRLWLGDGRMQNETMTEKRVTEK